jgi:hypothetical protein
VDANGAATIAGMTRTAPRMPTAVSALVVDDDEQYDEKRPVGRRPGRPRDLDPPDRAVAKHLAHGEGRRGRRGAHARDYHATEPRERDPRSFADVGGTFGHGSTRWLASPREAAFPLRRLRGRAISDEEALERIRALAIRPRGPTCGSRRVRREAPGNGLRRRRPSTVPLPRAFPGVPGAEKFDRLLRFATRLRLSGRRRRVTCGSAYEREWACALAIRLVNKAWFRVGSDRRTRLAHMHHGS